MKTFSLSIIAMFFTSMAFAQDANKMLAEIDRNMSANSLIMESTMIVHGKRNDRTMVSKSYVVGTQKSFTEYLSPARDKGTKMLKINKELWTYTPSTDRTIMISGHMLEQSVMGSDLSYQDAMEDRKLTETYNAVMSGEEAVNGRACYILTLTAKVQDVAYYSQKVWVDKTLNLPVKQELYAKSGQLLKRVTLSDFKKFGTRTYPTKMNYKDVMKEGKGTDWVISSIQFDVKIPEATFSKASLKQ